MVMINGDIGQQQRQPRWLRLLQIYSAKLVLEVFGGTGAVWGFSEAVGLRTSRNNDTWRVVSLCVGWIFFIRLLRQLKRSMEGEDEEKDGERKPAMSVMTDLPAHEASPLITFAEKREMRVVTDLPTPETVPQMSV